MILVNGVADGVISGNDRGLMYGDGVFRTMLMRHGHLLWWDDHYRKLNEDCAALKIACPPKNLLDQALKVAGENETECVIKITVTRGTGNRGYRVDAAISPTYIVTKSSIPHYPDDYRHRGIKARICDLKLSSQPLLAGIKHLNRLENVLARMEWDDPDTAEGILQDERGNIISGTMSNLFLVKDSVLMTPDLSSCGVAGVTRQRIMECSVKLNIPVSVQPVSMSHLFGADEIFLCNSVIGVWQIVHLQEKVWQPGLITPKIRHALHD